MNLQEAQPSMTVITKLPLAENVPIGHDATRDGPRGHGWRADAPATVSWVEAQDGGDPKTVVDHRVRISNVLRKNTMCTAVDRKVQIRDRTSGDCLCAKR